MACSVKQLVIGVAVGLVLAAVSISVIGGAAALAPATERVGVGAPDIRRSEVALPMTGGRLSDHQQLRRIFFDDARARVR